MLSYRFMRMEMEGLRRGTSNRSPMQLGHDGFSVAPLSMSMDMHMVGSMFAVNDRLTLMGMAHFVEKEMTLQPVGHSGMVHGGGHRMPHGNGTHGHSSAGLGDVVLGGLFGLTDDGTTRIHAGLSFGFPTADVEHKQAGRFLPYGMQSGNGIWDARPSVTLTQTHAQWSWGGQVSGVLALENENDAGFKFGNKGQATAWMARIVHPTTSVSLRTLYTFQGAIDGHYNGPHNHVAPPHFPENYGGETVSVGAGINVVAPAGWLAGHRFSAEYLLPVHQDVNGTQLEQDHAFTLGWQRAF